MNEIKRVTYNATFSATRYASDYITFNDTGNSTLCATYNNIWYATRNATCTDIENSLRDICYVE